MKCVSNFMKEEHVRLRIAVESGVMESNGERKDEMCGKTCLTSLYKWQSHERNIQLRGAMSAAIALVYRLQQQFILVSI